MYASSPEQSRRARVQALATQLHRERYGYLLRIARRHGGRGVDPDEAVQDAFAAFLDAFDPDGEAHPLAWLTLTLQRLCWAARDRRHLAYRIGATPSGLAAPDQPWRESSLTVDAGDVAERLDCVRETAAGMARLKSAERRALSLIGLGYSYREIGEITGWTRTKTNRCLAEGRAALRASGG
jgi:DNA-directed RNA polymerase specialized sigma24 family protein